MSLFSPAIEADLHGLVDGQVEAGRRTGVLRRLAASPSERARVEAWQAQNDFLRSTFAGVDREPIPATLDLRPRPQLHCIPANDAPLLAPTIREATPRRSRLATVCAIVVVTAGLIGSWTMLNQVEPDAASTMPTLRESIDADLARYAVAALGERMPADAPTGVLPTTKIPDLGSQGFRFVGAENDASRQPSSIQFRYRSEAGERLVVSVMRGVKSEAQRPLRVGHALRWRSGDKVYAMAGTVEPNRLLALSAALRDKPR